MADVIVLNEITELLNSVNNGLSSTLSTISTKIGNIETYTKTNNTASTTGTLSQKISSAISNTAATTTESSSGTLSAKLTYLINRRTKMVTPSSTNLKTLASSGNFVSAGGAGGEATTKTEYGQKYSCQVKYNGIYRCYFTSSVTWKDGSVSNSAGKNQQSVKVFGRAQVYHCGSGATSTHDVTITTTASANTSSVTKTVDVPAQEGDRITMCIGITQTSGEYTNICGVVNYYYDTYTATWTDISVRGTVNEINGATA